MWEAWGIKKFQQNPSIEVEMQRKHSLFNR